MKIYLDNASTTQLDHEVFEAMKPYLCNYVGNPSSIHSFGRESKVAVENSRAKIAECLNVSSSEIFFTSGSTESNNWVLKNIIIPEKITNIITTRIEHKSVLDPINYIEKNFGITINYLKINKYGEIDLKELDNYLMACKGKSLVSLMHVNNEIGNIYDLEKISNICYKRNAIFHSDTSQSMGHYIFDLSQLNLNSCVCSGHKLHGPRGIGFLYLKKGTKITPYLHGGNQEFGQRGGTENVANIVGIAKALEIANVNYQKDIETLTKLKTRMINGLKTHIPNIKFNGLSSKMHKSLCTILNISFNSKKSLEMILFALDIKNIAVSSGSACTSGSNVNSHVLENLQNNNKNNINIRISFSKYNSTKDIDQTINALTSVM